MKIPHKIKLRIRRYIRPLRFIFWFSIGAFLALFFITSFTFSFFQRAYKNVVYPGVMINGIDFGNKTPEQVREYFYQKNQLIKDTSLVFVSENGIASVSAEKIDFGFDKDLLASQAYSIGRSKDIFSDISLITQAYFNGIHLMPSYTFSRPKLEKLLNPIEKTIYKTPIEAQFKFENGRVTTFQLSEDGQEIDREKLDKQILAKSLTIMSSSKPQTIVFQIPVRVLKPSITTDEVNNLGLNELIGSGTSLFYHSIPARVYNINLAASKFNGVLIEPNEVFSFNKILGDISAFTGYKQAYIIQDGRTVLGDGGGVCQVSTTLFRALLNSGLPITERHAHAYRVGYYEQDAPPGLDATVYSPSVDLKFRNDTGNHILIQTEIDLNNLRLTFNLYGTKDDRQITISTPVVTNQTPAPEAVYQDDPTLAKGEVKQIDFAAPGASVYFTRQVVKNNKVIIYDKFVSNFQPWRAVFLRGTKE